MITNKTPTKTGNYHFKAEGREIWELVNVYEWNDPDDPLHVKFLETGAIFSVNYPKGQWSKIYNPEERQEAWGIYQNGMLCHSNESMPVAIQILERLTGKLWIDLQTYGNYTCKPVSIVPRESEVLVSPLKMQSAPVVFEVNESEAES